MANKFFFIWLTDWFLKKVNHPKAMWVFEKLVYLWFLVFALVLFPIKDILYGTDSFMFGVRLDDGLLNNFFLKLVYSKSWATKIYFLHVGAALWAFIGIPKVFHFVPKIIVFLTGWMFYYAAPPVFNGGYVLMISYSFFLIFSLPNSRSNFWIVLTNLSYIGIVLQLLVVYSTAAILKWQGHTWIDGSAAWLAANYSTYQNDTMLRFFSKNHWFALIINYAAFGYQTVFPLLVWFRKIKKPLLFIGVVFHLYTVFVMGIHFFGIAMMLAYLLFLDEKSKFIHFFWKRRVGNF